MYPFEDGALLGLQTPLLVVLALRNLLVGVLLGWALVRLVGLCRARLSAAARHVGAAQEGASA